MQKSNVKAVLFDYGGVMAEEGFYQGLLAIGRKAGLDPETFFRTVEALIHDSGYLTGNADESAFWTAVRKKTGIQDDDAGLREEILSRFVLRPDMVVAADLLCSKGLIVALLSDQTDWLDELDKRTDLFRHFDRVFNSYRTGMSKQDSAVFPYVCSSLGKRPEETLFIDDNAGHIARARAEGLHTIQCTVIPDCLRQLGTFVPLGTMLSGGEAGR